MVLRSTHRCHLSVSFTMQVTVGVPTLPSQPCSLLLPAFQWPANKHSLGPHELSMPLFVLITNSESCRHPMLRHVPRRTASSHVRVICAYTRVASRRACPGPMVYGASLYFYKVFGSSWALLAPPGLSWLLLAPPASSWHLLAPPCSSSLLAPPGLPR